MSYNTYPEHGTGMLLTRTETQQLIEAVNKIENESISDAYDLDNLCIGLPNIIVLTNVHWEHITAIDGSLIDERINNDLYGGCIICASKKASPFKAVYSGPEEIAAEMKESLDKYLPGFDYLGHLAVYEMILE